MAKRGQPEDVNERIVKKLGRIEDLLVNLVALQACVPTPIASRSRDFSVSITGA